MKKIVVNIQNGLMKEAVMRMLCGNGEFLPVAIPPGDENDTVSDCLTELAEIVLFEVSYLPDMTVEKRLREAKRIRERIPYGKIVFLCDENSSSDIAHDVMCAKRDGYIDHFFYSSLDERYMSAMLIAL